MKRAKGYHTQRTLKIRGVNCSKRGNVFSRRTREVFLKQWLLQWSAPRHLDSFNTHHMLQLIFTTLQGSKHLHINNPITQARRAGQKNGVSTLHPVEKWHVWVLVWGLSLGLLGSDHYTTPALHFQCTPTYVHCFRAWLWIHLLSLLFVKCSACLVILPSEQSHIS